MGENSKLDFVASIDANQAADYLRRIAEGLRTGTIGLSAGGQTVRLTPGSTVKLEIMARGKPADDRGSLAIDLSWKIKTKPTTPPLEISASPSDEPSNATPVDVVSAAEED
jgi:amphi-Trp domain-containing protein